MSLLSRATRLASKSVVTPATRRFAHDSFAALNILKDPSRAPIEKPDDEYPAWLWGLLDVKDSREELLREANALFDVGGYDEVLKKMDEKKLKRLFRIDSRERIRTRNSFGSINF